MNYKEIKFSIGNTIESAIKQLEIYKDKNELVFGTFNGQKLFSNIDDINSAYLKIIGITKAQCEEEERLRNEKYLEEKRIYEESLPKLTKYWIVKGRDLLDKKYRSKWNKCVPIRLRDIYRGYELKSTLEIIKNLKPKNEIEIAKTIMEAQGHSGMSFKLTCSMVKSFCDRGSDFVNYVNK